MVDVDSLARLALFADYSRPQLQAIAEIVDEEVYPRDARVLRRGLAGNGFYVILSGEASVRIDGEERARLVPGDFFGEASILTGDAPGADVVAQGDGLRCAVLPGEELESLLLAYPKIMLRMLAVGARRLQSANLWQR